MAVLISDDYKFERRGSVFLGQRTNYNILFILFYTVVHAVLAFHYETN